MIPLFCVPDARKSQQSNQFTHLDMSSHTIIVGGGIIGVTTAYYLARAGHRVTLLERNQLHEGASKGNAGIIALGHPPLGRPGLVWKTIKWMLDGGSPLYIPPRVDFGLFAWMWRFRSACTPAHFNHCMNILAQLGWETGECWDKLVADESLDCEYNTGGWLDVFLTREGMDHGLEDARLLNKHDYKTTTLSGDQLRAFQPAFLPEVVGAVHYTDSRFANPRRAVEQIADRAKKHGATLRFQTPVKSFVTSNGVCSGVTLETGEQLHADSVVLAAGVWSDALARQFGVRIPMQAGKGYHLNLTAPDPCPTVSCVLNETFVAVTPMDGGLRLAGTVELSGINHKIYRRRLEMLPEGARKYLHGIDQTIVKSEWCGLRPCTADGLPVIGWAPKLRNLFIAAGHAKYGFAYGPATARIAADHILSNGSAIDIRPFNADRF
ncbi:MAG TPA: FAD-dependent oxidoreductase [Phycisphaerales bacterium]|nr:FAD-dependent oxidoreductase [Phycisphaerales bacterium]